jgi:glycosyltransferase involved in cell wall biosynthesis
MKNPPLSVRLVGIPSKVGGIRRYAEDLTSSLVRRAIHLDATSPDLIHAVQPVLRPWGRKFVVTIHDLGPLNQNRSWRFTPIFRRRLERSLRRADAIVANSSQTAKEISQHFGYEGKTRIINIGISSRFYPWPRQPSGNISCTRDSLEYRRRIARKVGRRLYPLIGIAEEALVEYYRNLDYFVDFGMYRGFGYPILEARTCGVTVMTRRRAQIPHEVKELTIQVEDEGDAVEKIASGNSQPYLPIPFTLERMTSET